MSLDHENEGHWLTVIHEGLAEATAEAAKEFASHSLSALIPIGMAVPAAAFLVSAVRVLFLKLDDRSREIEKKLNVLLDEPFRTAARTLHDVATADITSPAEVNEAQRQLRTAYDNFSKALTYAEKEASSRFNLIRIYQGLTAALISGGRPFAEKIVTSLRSTSNEWLADAKKRQDAAEMVDVDGARNDLMLERRYPGPSSMRMEHAAEIMGLSIEVARRESQRDYLISESARLSRHAQELMRACELIEQLLPDACK